MQRTEATVTLDCGCSPRRSKGRKRCLEALDLNREFRRLETIERTREAGFGPASPERREAMAHRLIAWEDYLAHTEGRASRANDMREELERVGV